MVERFNPGKDPVHPLKDIIDKQSLLFNKREKKTRTAMYASDFGQCHRKIWCQFFPEKYPVEDEVDAKTSRIFANGNDVHVRLSKYFAAEPDLKFKEEVVIPRDELNVHGRCDGIMRSPADDRFQVLEFKSINAREVSQPKEEHQGQITHYLAMFEELRLALREEFEIPDGYYPSEDELMHMRSQKGRLFVELEEVEQRLLLSQGQVKGALIYEAKHGQAVSVFDVPLDFDKAQAVKQWFITLKQHIDEQRCPSVHYDPYAYPCQWGSGAGASRCAYWEMCHGKK